MTSSSSTPSTVERRCYYVGLPSQPQLVARTSTTPWIEPWGPHPTVPPKVLRPVGPHPLDKIWEDTLAAAIVKYLSAQVDWTSVDPARIGYEDSDVFPVILWVGVRPGSVSPEKGLEVVHGCKDILAEHGIHDVDVEMRESAVVLQGRLFPPADLFDSLARFKEPFSTTLGLSIARADTPHYEGTGGFYFIDSQRPGQLFLTTVRHLVFHPDTTENERYEAQSDDSEKLIDVILFGDAALKRAMDDIKGDKKNSEMELKSLKKMRETPGRNAWTEKAARKVADLAEMIKEHAELYSKVAREWGPPARRTIGHVVCSPPLAFSVGAGKFTEDWAVIQLDGSFDRHNVVGNAIDLGASTGAGLAVNPAMPLATLINFLQPHATSPRFKFPLDGLLRLSGTISATEMRNPTSVDENGDPCITVLKQGAMSGLTIGRLNTMQSVIRHHFKGVDSGPTREFAVYPCSSTSGAFSEAGDSGSLVIDGRGRAAGMLTGGAGTTDTTDCSYIVPMGNLLERLASNGYDARLDFSAADLH
ncbi:hypothetical protein MKEN_00360100 [Mycena kentingensis (nom. inval.)]|nr:hypothetical protein MKEN_00360100 [Mycena kentingensis (nom. inval.)]